MRPCARHYLALVIMGGLSILLLNVLLPKRPVVYRSSLHTGAATNPTRWAPSPSQPLEGFSLTVTNEDIDKFRVTLPALLPGFKNPCWIEPLPPYWNSSEPRDHCPIYKAKLDGPSRSSKQAMDDMMHILDDRGNRGEKWRIRCFPYFFLLGVTKCGTTQMFSTLELYAKDFARPGLKEPHYWDKNRASMKTRTCNDKPFSTFASYLDIFDLAAENIRTNESYGKGGQIIHTSITGDFSPSTLNVDHHWSSRPGNKGLTEPKYSTPNYIRHLYPKAKFMVIMRDPVERFYSNYRMNQEIHESRNDWSGATLLEAANHSVTLFRECERQLTPRACAYHAYKRHVTYVRHLTRGLYDVFIKDWLKVFPREQFLFMTTEDFKINRFDGVQRIFSFLKLDPLTPSLTAALRQEQSEQRSSTPPSAPAMDRKAEKLLRDFYRPHVKELVRLLNDDLFDWTKTWS